MTRRQNVDLEVDAISRYDPYQEALDYLQQHCLAYQVYCIDGVAACSSFSRSWKNEASLYDLVARAAAGFPLHVLDFAIFVDLL